MPGLDLSQVPLVLLHLSAEHAHWYIVRPAESHHTFGSGFVLLGSLMVAERLSGRVWFRSTLRTLIFPVTLVLLGWGMLTVTVVEPDARIAHFAMGLPMVIGGWSEYRYRRGEIPRAYADAFIIPALLFAAVDTALFHLDGPPTSGGFLTHAALALTAAVLAALRLHESANPASLARGLLLCAGVFLVSLELYADALFL
ncbi:MAG TPA: hypothetical protein VNN10_15380 [Dehalococcoidia bacterium]|nr:hypothetical protein [Dehalococcoidia bacterium]